VSASETVPRAEFEKSLKLSEKRRKASASSKFAP
jgi:hypothetical protein